MLQLLESLWRTMPYSWAAGKKFLGYDPCATMGQPDIKEPYE
jgi:hypothetical protein